MPENRQKTHIFSHGPPDPSEAVKINAVIMAAFMAVTLGDLQSSQLHLLFTQARSGAFGGEKII